MKPDQCTAAESPLRTQRTPVNSQTSSDQFRLQKQFVSRQQRETEMKSLTQQDLQSVGVQVQSLRLLLHHVHLLRLLVVVTVDAGVGQHLQAGVRESLGQLGLPREEQRFFGR